MTPKANKNPIHGIEQLFAGLVPDTDARAFQSPPRSAVRSRWRVVSSDGSRSDAEPHSASESPSDSSRVTGLTATEISFFEHSFSATTPPRRSTPVDLPHVKADLADLTEAWRTVSGAKSKNPEVRADTSVSPRTPSQERNGSIIPEEEGCLDEAEGLQAQEVPPLHRGQDDSANAVSSRDSRANYELARVVQAWSRLPVNIRNAILAIIDSL